MLKHISNKATKMVTKSSSNIQSINSLHTTEILQSECKSETDLESSTASVTSSEFKPQLANSNNHGSTGTFSSLDKKLKIEKDELQTNKHIETNDMNKLSNGQLNIVKGKNEPEQATATSTTTSPIQQRSSESPSEPKDPPQPNRPSLNEFHDYDENIGLKTLRPDYHDLSTQLYKKDVNLKDPLSTVKSWIKQAVKENVLDANAFNLATVDVTKSPPRPANRIVLCKEICLKGSYKEKGIKFYTNKSSRKGVEIKANNLVAATFFWPPLHKSIRLEGYCKEIPDIENDNYFYSRPSNSQAASACSQQSKFITSKEKMIENYNSCLKQAEANELVRPERWGGYLIVPDYIEFWHGNSFRLHDRIVCKRVTGDTEVKWTSERIQP